LKEQVERAKEEVDFLGASLNKDGSLTITGI
jgi:hypothetical protein